MLQLQPVDSVRTRKSSTKQANVHAALHSLAPLALIHEALASALDSVPRVMVLSHGSEHRVVLAHHMARVLLVERENTILERVAHPLEHRHYLFHVLQRLGIHRTNLVEAAISITEVVPRYFVKVVLHGLDGIILALARKHLGQKLVNKSMRLLL